MKLIHMRNVGDRMKASVDLMLLHVCALFLLLLID